jgi:uncharacterized protein YecE (DUF72 family)
MTVFLGTSGWQYRHWRGRFYPNGLPTSRWLSYYVERFATVEVNNTFYRLPERSTFENWRSGTPEGFVVAVKASRYLTHIKRLRDPADPVELFVDHASGLADRLGPVLLQLPPTLEVDVGLLADALAAFPTTFRLAVEFRHDSWYRDDVRAALEARGAALCLADRREKLLTPAWRTADWGYVRFHGGIQRPASCYRPEHLEASADVLCDTWRAGEDVFVYFNNDHAGCAIRDVARLGLMLDRRGRDRTRTDVATELAA